MSRRRTRSRDAYSSVSPRIIFFRRPPYISILVLSLDESHDSTRRQDDVNVFCGSGEGVTQFTLTSPIGQKKGTFDRQIMSPKQISVTCLLISVATMI